MNPHYKENELSKLMILLPHFYHNMLGNHVANIMYVWVSKQSFLHFDMLYDLKTVIFKILHIEWNVC